MPRPATTGGSAPPTTAPRPADDGSTRPALAYPLIAPPAERRPRFPACPKSVAGASPVDMPPLAIEVPSASRAGAARASIGRAAAPRMPAPMAPPTGHVAAMLPAKRPPPKASESFSLLKALSDACRSSLLESGGVMPMRPSVDWLGSLTPKPTASARRAPPFSSVLPTSAKPLANPFAASRSMPGPRAALISVPKGARFVMTLAALSSIELLAGASLRAARIGCAPVAAFG